MISAGQSLFALIDIRKDYWSKAMFVPIPHYSKSDRNRVWAPGENGTDDVYVDVVVNMRELRKKWPALWPWERPRVTPWSHAVANAEEFSRRHNA